MLLNFRGIIVAYRKDVYAEVMGKRFGMLTVVDRPEKGSIKVKCLCDCGNIHYVAKANLKKEKGGVRSCGCNRNKANSEFQINRWKDENFKPSFVKHNMSKTKTHNAWTQMKQRSKDSGHFTNSYYLDRGITYDPSWESFENFYEDMGECPEGMTLDRIDVDGNYCKENCRWTDFSEQAFNTRKQINNTSGRTGVVWNKKTQKWEARMNINKKQTCVGLFVNFEDAVAAREKAELEMYGYTKE